MNYRYMLRNIQENCYLIYFAVEARNQELDNPVMDAESIQVYQGDKHYFQYTKFVISVTCF